MDYHKLLKRQLRKYLNDSKLEDQPAMEGFLAAISDAYENYDKDRELSQRAFDISDREYQEITEKLTKEKDDRENSVQTLLSTIANLEKQSGLKFEYDKTDLVTIARVLEHQVTGRIKTEGELRESEENFRQINETIEDVFWLYDSSEKNTSI